MQQTQLQAESVSIKYHFLTFYQADLLQNSWQFWFHERQGKSSSSPKNDDVEYREQLKELGEMKTLQQFLSYYKYL